MPQISKQLLILQRITTHLRGITPANGYEVDLSASVYRGRTIFGEETALPCLSILEAPRPDDGVVTGGDDRLKRTEQWVLLVQGWVADDKDNPTDPAYELKAAVEKRLSEIVVRDGPGRATSADAYELGGLIMSMQIGPGVVRPPTPEISSRAFFYLPIVITMVMSPKAPFITIS